MKKFTLLFGLLVVSLCFLTAQPVLTQNDIGFQIGDVQVIDSIDFLDMTSQEGPNMTWDLSSLSPQGTLLTAEVVTPSSTSNGALFPTSTIARTITIPELTIDQFFNFDGASMQHLGTTLSFGVDDIISNYTDPEIAIPLPMTYGSSGSDNYASVLSGGPLASESSGQIDWEVPGYGTLIVNGQTYTDVLMYKLTRDDVTTSSFGGTSFEFLSLEVTYLFMASGYHYPIVVFTEITNNDEFTPPETTYEGSVLISQTTSLADLSDILPDLSVFPNPVHKGVLTLEYTLDAPTEMSLELVDLSGRIILNRNSTSQVGLVSQTILLPDNLEAGLYLLNISSEDGFRSVRIVVE